MDVNTLKSLSNDLFPLGATGFSRALLTIVFVVSLCLMLSAPTLAKEAEVKLNLSGNCASYNATLTAYNLPAQRYDVKVDVTSPGGRIGKSTIRARAGSPPSSMLKTTSALSQKGIKPASTPELSLEFQDQLATSASAAS